MLRFILLNIVITFFVSNPANARLSEGSVIDDSRVSTNVQLGNEKEVSINASWSCFWKKVKERLLLLCDAAKDGALDVKLDPSISPAEKETVLSAIAKFPRKDDSIGSCNNVVGKKTGKEALGYLLGNYDRLPVKCQGELYGAGIVPRKVASSDFEECMKVSGNFEQCSHHLARANGSTGEGHLVQAGEVAK